MLIVGDVLREADGGQRDELFGLSKTEEIILNEVPMRGTATPMPRPTR